MHHVLLFQRHEPDLEGPAADDPEWEYIPDYALDEDSEDSNDDKEDMLEESFEDHDNETKSHDSEEDNQTSSDAT